MITYGSYTKDEVSIVKSVNQIEIFDTGIAILAGMTLVEAAVEKAENEKKRAPSYLPLHAYSSVDEAITAYAISIYPKD